MKFEELSVLLPCHSLEDFPLYYDGDAADGLLAAWSALWHPALIAGSGKPPAWHRVDDPPTPASGLLLVVPGACNDRVSHDYIESVRSAGGLVIEDVQDRAIIVETALAAMDTVPSIDDDLAADFLALGYCRLQVELLTRQMRYSSNIDELAFNADLLAVAAAAAEGDTSQAYEYLGKCFTALYEARKYFYPVDAYLIDVTLLDEATPAADLSAELSTGLAPNLLAPAGVLEKLLERQPELSALIRDRWRAGDLAIVGGELVEAELPILTPEGVRRQISEGLAHYERLLGRRPIVFGRRRHGMFPLLPQVLVYQGYVGALHFTFDEGRVPTGPQAKVRWEGGDGSVIDALARPPRDAAKHETFLEFSRLMGETMDTDHVATVVFAHWPGAVSPWYDDLRRIGRRSDVLGKFITLESYFRDTEAPGRITKFEADEYRTPYLRQAVNAGKPNPLSRHVAEFREEVHAQAVDGLAFMGSVLSGVRHDHVSPPLQLTPALEDVCEALSVAPASAGEQGCLALNPFSFTRLVEVECTSTGSATGSAGAPPGKLLVETPPMGFAWSRVAQSTAARSKPAVLAEANLLRNELLEVVISDRTGGIQSVHELRRRGNRISQQLTMRSPGPPARPGDIWRSPDETAMYSQMVVDSSEVVESTGNSGAIATRGRLLTADGTELARYVQTVQLLSGSRIVKLSVELLSATIPSGSDPWEAYFASRWAWADADAELFRSQALQRVRTDAKRIEAPTYLEIVSSRGSISLLPGGLPYHRRSGVRMLDSLLVVAGEECRRFDLALGMGIAQPAAAALNLAASEGLRRCPSGAPGAGDSGWLFRLNPRGVIATSWEAVSDEGSHAVRGFRVRLLETSSRPAAVSLDCYRKPKAARQIDASGRTLLELAIDGDKIALSLAALEWVYVEVTW